VKKNRGLSRATRPRQLISGTSKIRDNQSACIPRRGLPEMRDDECESRELASLLRATTDPPGDREQSRVMRRSKRSPTSEKKPGRFKGRLQRACPIMRAQFDSPVMRDVALHGSRQSGRLSARQCGDDREKDREKNTENRPSIDRSMARFRAFPDRCNRGSSSEENVAASTPCLLPGKFPKKFRDSESTRRYPAKGTLFPPSASPLRPKSKLPARTAAAHLRPLLAPSRRLGGREKEKVRHDGEELRCARRLLVEWESASREAGGRSKSGDGLQLER